MPCPERYYRASEGATSQDDCALCVSGGYCLSGSTDPAECPRGFYCVTGRHTQHASTSRADLIAWTVTYRTAANHRPPSFNFPQHDVLHFSSLPLQRPLFDHETSFLVMKAFSASHLPIAPGSLYLCRIRFRRDLLEAYTSYVHFYNALLSSLHETMVESVRCLRHADESPLALAARCSLR